MDTIIIVTEDVSVIELDQETVITTIEEVPTIIEMRGIGPQGPPSFVDAPNDGKLYGRMNGAWVEIP